MKYFNLLILAASLSIAPQAWADGKEHSQDHESDYNAFTKRAMNQMPIPFKKEKSNKARVGGFSQYFFGRKSEETLPQTTDIFRDPFGYKGSEGDNNEAGDYENEKGGLNPDKIIHKTYSFPVNEARKALMKGDAIYKGTQRELSEDTTLYFISWAQVEPGIAQGLQLANATVDSYMSNTYKAYEAFINQPFENPQVRQKIITIMNECIFKKMDEESKSWFAAVTMCLGDTKISEESKRELKEEDTGVTEKQLKNELHPSYKKSGATVDDKISVASELFNYGTEQKTKRDSLYKAWKEMFGDYEIMIEEDEGGANNGEQYNTYKIREKRIPPTKRMGEFARMITADRYKDFMQLCQAYCNHMQTVGDNSEGTEKSFWIQKNFQGGDNSNRVFRLSAPERVIDADVIEITVNIVMINLQTDQFQDAFNFFKENLDLENLDFDALNKNINRDVILFARGYAHYVAMSQLLRTVQEAVKFVRGRTAGTGAVDATIADRAIQLIDDVVDISQLNRSLQENAIAWDQFVRNNIQLAWQKAIANAGLGAQVKKTGK